MAGPDKFRLRAAGGVRLDGTRQAPKIHGRQRQLQHVPGLRNRARRPADPHDKRGPEQAEHQTEPELEGELLQDPRVQEVHGQSDSGVLRRARAPSNSIAHVSGQPERQLQSRGRDQRREDAEPGAAEVSKTH